MSKLKTVEAKRLELVRELSILLGLPPDKVSVSISLHDQPMEGSLDIEAGALGWSFDCHGPGCVQQGPDNQGSVTLFLLEKNTEWVNDYA